MKGKLLEKFYGLNRTWIIIIRAFKWRPFYFLLFELGPVWFRENFGGLVLTFWLLLAFLLFLLFLFAISVISLTSLTYAVTSFTSVVTSVTSVTTSATIGHYTEIILVITVILLKWRSSSGSFCSCCCLLKHRQIRHEQVGYTSIRSLLCHITIRVWIDQSTLSSCCSTFSGLGLQYTVANWLWSSFAREFPDWVGIGPHEFGVDECSQLVVFLILSVDTAGLGLGLGLVE